ncbi:MAG TPA: NAD(P)/FAD-dependent oxidoreductase [Polyangiaceae bacterium]|nr:NAD(P)/FAD-dependent oxidoreductase [Polyangiaceae bacterium]
MAYQEAARQKSENGNNGAASRSEPPHVGIAIVGSGFAGLGAAILLKREGIEEFAIFERAADVGGTWRDNSYPGCACDVESHLYSFSFAPNPTWSRSYSPQAEIFAYLRRCADEYGLRPHLRFRHELVSAAWDEGRKRWVLETSSGTYTADVLIGGMGAFSEPSIPPLPGLGSFQGKVFHSARWDHDYDLRGREVAVIGTGASAIQFVPEIQPRVGKLRLFQRTPAWVVPRYEHTLGPRTQSLYRAAPILQKLARSIIYARRELFVLAFRHPRIMRLVEAFAVRYLKQTIADPELRAKLTPSFRMGCKRILISNEYLPALAKENAEVITEPIREVRARSIVTEDGVEHPVDTIICGTGFRVTEMPFADRIRGRSGRTLAETWQGSPTAHWGTTVSGFPNLFLLLGPNTGLGHTSVVFMIESQLELVIEAIRHMRRHGIAALEPRREEQARFVAQVEGRMRGTVWSTGGCASWYVDKTGRNSTLWPGFTFSFRRRCRFRPDEYALEPRVDAASKDAAAARATPGSASLPA